MNYFTLLDLTPQFDLDLAALEAAYFKAQRQTHPDRFVGRPQDERVAALQHSVDINAAYNTLKTPLLRAQYLLHLQGITVGTEQDSVKPSHELLLETMQWREKIDEAESAAIDAIEAAMSDMVTRTIKIIANAYMYAQWDKMAQEVLRLNYALKAQEAAGLKKNRKKQAL